MAENPKGRGRNKKSNKPSAEELADEFAERARESVLEDAPDGLHPLDELAKKTPKRPD